MKRILIYLGFIAATIVVVFTFVTASNYPQLILAVGLYLPLTYLAYRTFIRTAPVQAAALTGDITTANMAANSLGTTTSTGGGGNNSSFVTQGSGGKVELAKVQVEDIDKRTFLKLIGAAGLSFFVFSLLGKGLESLFLSKTSNSGSNLFGLKPPDQDTGLSPTQGYNIAQVDDTDALVTYYGFVNQNKGWFIMKENLEDNSYRYARGDANFESNWQNRENLNYDYYYNQFN